MVIEIYQGIKMKNPSSKRNIGKWMFKAYILWSICADDILIAGIIACYSVMVKSLFDGGEIGSTGWIDEWRIVD